MSDIVDEWLVFTFQFWLTFFQVIPLSAIESQVS